MHSPWCACSQKRENHARDIQHTHYNAPGTAGNTVDTPQDTEDCHTEEHRGQPRCTQAPA